MTGSQVALLVVVLLLTLFFTSQSSPTATAFQISSPSLRTTKRTTALFAAAEEQGPASTGTKVKPTGITLKVAFDEQWGVGEGADKDIVVSERFTCPESLDMVHRLRRDSDAVLVGRGTVDRDNCSLTVRRGITIEDNQQPLRVILDPRLSLILAELNEGETCQLLTDGLPTVVYHCVPDIDLASLCISEKVSVIYLPPPVEDIPELPEDTYEQNRPGMYIKPSFVAEHLKTHFAVKRLMVEGGPVTASNFLQDGLVDRAILVKAPIRFQEPIPSGMTKETFQKAGLELIGSRSSGVDTIEYWARPGDSWPGDSIEDWP